jgi:hypothetical protein
MTHCLKLVVCFVSLTLASTALAQTGADQIETKTSSPVAYVYVSRPLTSTVSPQPQTGSSPLCQVRLSKVTSRVWR